MGCGEPVHVHVPVADPGFQQGGGAQQDLYENWGGGRGGLLSDSGLTGPTIIRYLSCLRA